MNTKSAYFQLIRLRDRQKQLALWNGHYPTPHTAEVFDARDKSKAFRSIGYNDCIRDASALQLAIDLLRRELGSK